MTRRRTIQFLFLLALGLLSLRPVQWVEQGADRLCAPLAALRALAFPLGWVRGRTLRARDLDALERELARCRQVRDAYRVNAHPSDPALLAGRGTIEAEVVGRGVDSLDRIVVRLVTTEGVVVGAPVVCNRHYVGEIVGFDARHPELATVELVTSSRFRVGGAAEDGQGGRCALVVGGLAVAAHDGDTPLQLAVHNPEVRGLARGTVRVLEPRALLAGESFATLADGFVLGELTRAGERDDAVLTVRPGLDYETGLYHVVVLCPQDAAPLAPPPVADLFADEDWRTGTLVSPGETSAWRATQKLTFDGNERARPGAALRDGARFVGRVERSAVAGRADVRLIGDPGLAFPALALVLPPESVSGERRAHLVELGRVVFEAAPESGHLNVRWQAAAAMPRRLAGEAAQVRAEIYTGAGDSGVPLGLRVADAWLPTAAGTHLIELEGAVERSSLRRVAVRHERDLEAAP